MVLSRRHRRAGADLPHLCPLLRHAVALRRRRCRGRYARFLRQIRSGRGALPPQQGAAARGIRVPALSHLPGGPRQTDGRGHGGDAGAARLSRSDALPHRRPPAQQRRAARALADRSPAAIRPPAIFRADAAAALLGAGRPWRPAAARRCRGRRSRSAAPANGRVQEPRQSAHRAGEPGRSTPAWHRDGSSAALAHLAGPFGGADGDRPLRRERHAALGQGVRATLRL